MVSNRVDNIGNLDTSRSDLPPSQSRNDGEPKKILTHPLTYIPRDCLHFA